MDNPPFSKKPRIDINERNNVNQQMTSRAALRTSSTLKNSSPLYPKPDINKVLGRNTIQDDSDDEELWYHASQIEKEVLEKDRSSQPSVQETPEITYSDFQTKKPMASTQATNRVNFKEPPKRNVPQQQQFLPSQISQFSSNKENVSDSQLPFQNKYLHKKCTALELQVKRLKEQLTKGKMQSSQEVSKHSHEVDRMRERMFQLERENNEFKHSQLISLSQNPAKDDNNLQHEVDSLREQVRNLMKLKDENKKLKSLIKSEKSGSVEKAINKEVDKDSNWRSIAYAPNLADHVTHLPNPPKFYKPIFNKAKQLCDHELELQFIINEFIFLNQAQKEDFDTCWQIFEHIFTAVRDVCECIQEEELKRDFEILKREDFRSRQAELISIQIHNDDQLQTSNSNNNLQLIGLDNQKHVSKIKLIGMMAVLARESCTLSTMIASVNVNTLCTFKNEDEENFTLLDIFTHTIQTSIIPSRQYAEYTPFTYAVATLGCSITQHYISFDDYSIIDVSLAKFLNKVLAITLNSADILIKLVELCSNLAKSQNCNRLFTKLCKNYPSENIKSSKRFRLLQIPLCGCELQILFILIVNAFPQQEKLPPHRIELVFKLAENLHIFTQRFILHGNNMKCLSSKHKIESPDSCKCLSGLLSAMVTLQAIILNHRNENFNKYKFQIKAAVRSFVISMNVLLQYARDSNDFEDCVYVIYKLHYIYTVIKHGDIYDEDSGTRIKAYDFYLNSSGNRDFIKRSLDSLLFVEKEREVIHDKKLQKSLDQLREHSLQKCFNFDL